MFDILRKSLSTGVVTTSYPAVPAEVSSRSRGRPEFNLQKWKDARTAAAVCPTGALNYVDQDGVRKVSFNLANCTFCGLCAEVDSAIRMTNECELAVRRKEELLLTAEYQLGNGGAQAKLISSGNGKSSGTPAVGVAQSQSIEDVGAELKKQINRVLGRSLHIREVDAGSCNGCEVEIVALNSPV